MNKYILKLELNDTDAWREISLTGGTTFSDLHTVIQIAFGWEDYHLHEFTVGDMTIGMLCEGESIEDFPPDFHIEDEVNLELILLNQKTFEYAYDFGDGWEIAITVEEIQKVDKAEAPKIINFGGNMAKEDCGGPDGLMGKRRRKTDVKALNSIIEDVFAIRSVFKDNRRK